MQLSFGVFIQLSIFFLFALDNLIYVLDV